MTRQRGQDDFFDPLAPIGGDGGEDLAPPGRSDAPDPPADRQDERLARLLEQATRPPAVLKLDWARLRSSLAEAPALRISRPARPRARFFEPRARRIVLWLAGAMSAAAAILIGGLLYLNHLSRDTGAELATRRERVEPTAPALPAAPTVAIGLSPAAARELVQQPAADSSGVVVVFPRQQDVPAAPAAPANAAPAPIVISERAGLSGTPRGEFTGGDGDSDVVFLSF